MQHLLGEICKNKMHQLSQENDTIDSSELEQLRERVVFGPSRYRLTESNCPASGFTCIESHLAAHFAFFNSDNLHLVSFQSKVRVWDIQPKFINKISPLFKRK